MQRYYNDTNPTTFVGAEDKGWSKAKGGLTLNNLDAVAGNGDNAKVEIQFSGSGANPYNFTITSTGYYRNAKRKIEAKLKGIGGVGGGSNNIVNPGYYTPSGILIKGTFEMAGVSLSRIKTSLSRPSARRLGQVSRLTLAPTPEAPCRVLIPTIRSATGTLPSSYRRTTGTWSGARERPRAHVIQQGRLCRPREDM